MPCLLQVESATCLPEVGPSDSVAVSALLSLKDTSMRVGGPTEVVLVCGFQEQNIDKSN